MVKGYMDALPQYSQVGIPAECIEKISEYVNSWELVAFWIALLIAGDGVLITISPIDFAPNGPVGS